MSGVGRREGGAGELTHQRSVGLGDSERVAAVLAELGYCVSGDWLQCYGRQDVFDVSDARDLVLVYLQYLLRERDRGLERRGAVRLSEARRVHLFDLEDKVGEARDARRRQDVGDRGGEVVEDGWWAGGGIGVVDEGGAEEGGVVVGEVEDQRRVLVGVAGGGRVYEGVESGDQGGGGADGVGDGAAPHWALGVGLEVEAGNDAEVVAAAAEGEEEGGVGGAVDVCYGGVGEDELRGF